MTNSIHEVLTYGSIVASDEELDILITVNGAYFNVWCCDYSGSYTNTDCIATGFEGGLYGQDMVKVVERAEEILEDIRSKNQDEGENDEE